MAVDGAAPRENISCRAFCTRDFAGVFAVAQNKFLIFADTNRRIPGLVDGERFAVQTEIDSDVCDVERVGDSKIVFEVYIYRF